MLRAMNDLPSDDRGGKIVQGGCGLLALIAAALAIYFHYWDPSKPPLPTPVEVAARSQAYKAGHETAVNLMKTGALKMSDEAQVALSKVRFPSNEEEQHEFRRGYQDVFRGIK